jgi:excisionase family DNA binding protein
MGEPAKMVFVSFDDFRAAIREEVRHLAPATLDEWMTSDEVAKWLGVKRSTLPSLVTREKLPCYRPGKSYTFKRSEVEAWLMERCNRPGAKPRGRLRDLRRA